MNGGVAGCCHHDMETIQLLETSAAHFKDIDNELEQLKAELLQNTSGMPDALKKHEAEIISWEKRINKELSQTRKFYTSKTSHQMLNLGKITPEMEKSLDNLVAQHLNHSGVQSVAQLMKKNATDDNEELTDFAKKSKSAFNEIENGTLTILSAAQVGLNRDMFQHLKDKSRQLGFYKALSQSVTVAYEFLTSLSSNDFEEVSSLSGKLVGMSADEAHQEYQVLKSALLAELLLFYRSQQAGESSKKTPESSDLELLISASQVALETSFKELQMLQWNGKSELPHELALSNTLYFHPIFVCPVTQEQSSTSRLVMLNCGHLFSKAAFDRFISDTYPKCPYCKKEVNQRGVRTVNLSMV